jgi:hypothetical protein
MAGDEAQSGGSDGLHCARCGYNLTGLPQQRCPECGDAFSRSDPFCHPQVIAHLVRRQKVFLILQIVGGPLLVGLLTTALVAFGSNPGPFMVTLSQLAAILLCVSLVGFSWSTASRIDPLLALRAGGARGRKPWTIIVLTLLLIPIHFLLGLPVLLSLFLFFG